MIAEHTGVTHVRAGATAQHAAHAMMRLLPGLRAEEFIARGRLILGLGLLLAVAGDDALPSSTLSAAETLLVAYSLFAAAIMAGLYFARAQVIAYPILIHAIDIAALATLLLLTGGATQGYFSPLFFPIASGALRWRQKGVVQTGLAILIVYSGVAASEYFAGQLHVNTWLVRKVALIATVLLVAEMGAAESRYVTRILKLSRWPKLQTGRLETLATQILSRAVEMFRGPRGLLVLEDFDEPWHNVFSWEAGKVTHTQRRQDGKGVPFARPPLGEFPFLIGGAAGASALYVDEKGPRARHAAPFADWLRAHVDDVPTIVIPLRSDSVSGYLFIVDSPDISIDDLRLADLLARQATDSLEQFALARELRHASAAEERARVSRDLHDGVLQSMSGIAMRIAGVRRSVRTPPETGEQLQEIERLMLDEQRNLRFFTEELRSPVAGDVALLGVDALVGLVQRLERIWSVQVIWDPTDAERVPPRLAADVYRIVHESVVNAARHGQATHIRLRMAIDEGNLHLVVSDDGNGFPFVGRFTLSELAEARRGPRTLRERVQQLGGQLFITSSRAGAEIEIVLHAPEGAA